RLLNKRTGLLPLLGVDQLVDLFPNPAGSHVPQSPFSSRGLRRFRICRLRLLSPFSPPAPIFFFRCPSSCLSFVDRLLPFVCSLVMRENFLAECLRLPLHGRRMPQLTLDYPVVLELRRGGNETSAANAWLGGIERRGDLQARGVAGEREPPPTLRYN